MLNPPGTGKNKRNAGELPAMLEQLVKASESGDFSVFLDPESLDGAEAEAARLINSAVHNYKKITEYNLMKFELANKARNVGLWDTIYVSRDLSSPDNVVIWSREMCDILGYSEDGGSPGKGEFYLSRIHPDDAGKVIAALDAHLADRTGQTPFYAEYRFKDNNGEYGYYQATGTTQRDRDGLPLRTAGALKDITAERRARIDEEAERVKLILDSAPFSVTLWDRNMNLLDCSAVAMERHGFTDRRNLTASALGIMPEYQPDGGLTAEIINKAFKTAFERGYNRFEVWYPEASGELIPLDVRCVRIKYGDDFSVVAYSRDLREQMAAVDKVETALFETNKTIEVLKSILNESEAMIFVCDTDEGSIIFATEPLKRHFGFEGDITGQICYKTLYPDKDSRCDWCPRRQLDKKPDEVVVWEERNTVTGGYYRNIDRYTVWPDGKRVHLQYRVDLTDSKKTQEDLERQHKTANLLHEMGRTLLEANDSLGNLIVKSMGLIGKFFNTDRVKIWRNDMAGDSMHFTVLYEWVSDFARELPAVPAGLTIPRETMPGWEDILRRGDCVNNTLSSFGPNERELMNRCNVKTLAAIPLFLAGKFWGALTVADCRRERAFSDDEINNIKTAGRLAMSATIRNEMLTSIRAERDRNAELSHWYEAILDAVPHLITVTDTDMHYLFANKPALKYLGMAREELLGRHCGIANSPICGTEDCSITRAKQGLSQTYFKNGGMSFQVDTEKLEDLEGRTVAYVEVIQDISKIEEIAEKQALAEAASEAKTRFLANMSHEIRTPMNSIIGFTELALDSAISQKTIEYLKLINANSELLMQIINDILDISKVEAGSMDLETIPFDLLVLFQSCLSVMTPKAKEKNIELRLSAEVPEGKKVLGDPTRLTQVIINLLSNAVKFTDTGSVELAVSLCASTEQSATICFKVSDTGIGITDGQIQSIFKPFVQADLSTTRKYGGTGLGLTIAKNLVEIMGGKLEIESAPNIGTTVSFTLTFDTTDQPDETAENGAVSKLDKPVFEGVILVCEDNEMNQWVIREHLERVGFEVAVAENGKVGVDKVRERAAKNEKPFDLIFMDIHMPVMDGIEAVSRIIELDTGAPIVALTANIMSGEREEYRALGMKDYIPKPFTSQELYRCLLKYLKPVGFTNISEQEKERDNKLQIQLRKDFVKTNQRKADEITEAAAAGDTALAYRLAHTLKSTAGLIGKPLLQNAAAAVESALKNGENWVTETRMDSLRSELSAVLSELAPYADEDEAAYKPPAGAAAGEYDAGKTRELFNRLEPLLVSGNLESLNFVDALRPIPGSGDLIKQIEDLYFEEAVRAFAELKAKTGG